METRTPGFPAQIRPFLPATQADAVDVINAYLAGWPYTRPVDSALLAHWPTLEQFQPENIWLAYRDGRARAVLHGQLRPAPSAVIHLLAVLPGAAADAAWLLGQFEKTARAEGAARLVGPHWAGAAFYGGYVLGQEPYHPHWAVEATEAYVRAGFRISHPGVILVCDLVGGVAVESPPAGYEFEEVGHPEEFQARTFGYRALYGGQEVAHCYARLFSRLVSPAGGPVGQLGPVGTDEAHRGRGLARVMTRMCLERLRDWGAAEALIATGLDNRPALRAYERAGFARRYNINEWSKELG